MCKHTDCLDNLPQVTYCATNGIDHYERCCAKKGIPAICEPFCNGEKPISIAAMFPDLVSAIDYFPCFEHRFEILNCIGRNHDGVHRAKKRQWSPDKVDPELVELVREISCNYEDDDWN